MPRGFDHSLRRLGLRFRLGRQLRAPRLDALERLGGALDRLVADLHQQLDVAGARAAARALHRRARREHVADRLELRRLARRTLGHDIGDLPVPEDPAPNLPPDYSRPNAATPPAWNCGGR